MNVEILSRAQFGITIMFHYIFPPLSIGLGLMLVIMEGLYLKTKNLVYYEMTRFWTRIFALTFALGVATGIVMEFQFGTNWSNYSRFVGDVFGSALAAEGVFAFFLESGFLALLLFGWKKIGKKMHYFATCMVCLGAHFSAVWIVVANSWMQTPAGYHIVPSGSGMRAEILDFWAMVFNPSSVDRLTHTILGCWLAGSFLVVSVCAYYFLKGRHLDFAKKGMKIAIIVSFATCILQGIVGDRSAKGVAKNQPAKLAALEARFKTEKGAGLSLIGIPNKKERRIDYNIEIPKLLSWLIYKDTNAEVTGLDKFPEKDWPKVIVVYYSYRLMLGLGIAMLFLSFIALILLRKERLYSHRFFLKMLVASGLFPQIANQAGWLSAEMGRYPWIVQGHMRISEGLSLSVTEYEVLGSIIMFTFIYTLLFIMFIYLLNHKIQIGPTAEDQETPYHHMQDYIEESE